MLKIFAFLLLGFGATTLGSLVGLGGGFIIMPVLLLLYPDAPKESLTAISLCTIFVNSLFSTISYFKQDKIRLKAGIALLIATFPGAIVGSLTTSIISPSVFNKMMSILLAGIAIFILWKKQNDNIENEQSSVPLTRAKVIGVGIPFSFLTGFLSSFFGIGGGIINMPVLIHILKFPIKVAVGTSMFIILIMTFTGTSVHIIQKTLSYEHLSVVVPLCIGSIMGGLAGAQISTKIHSQSIVLLLSVSLLLTAIKLFFF